MPAPPISIAAPAGAAVAAGLAYLNARTAASHDLGLFSGIVQAWIQIAIRQRRDRLSQFYVLEERARSPKTANRTFIRFEDKSHTFAQTYDLALRCGAWLRSRFCVRPRDIVAIDVDNSDTFVFLLFGLWSIGAKPAFINTNLTGRGLAHCVRTATTRLLIVDEHVVARAADGAVVGPEVQAELPGVQIVVLTEELLMEMRTTAAERRPDAERSDAVSHAMALLIYTSGTTGLPKAAVVAWSKLIIGSVFGSSVLGLKMDDVFYTSMPLYHSSATILCLGPCLTTGATMALGRRFSTKTFWSDVRQHNATIIQYVGETCRYLLAAPPELDSIKGRNLDRCHRVLTAFGNGLRPDVWSRFKGRFGIERIIEFYAATEGTTALWNVSRNDFSAGAIGRGGFLYHRFFAREVDIARVRTLTRDRSPTAGDSDSSYSSSDEGNCLELVRDPHTNLCERTSPGETGELVFMVPPDNIASRFQGYFGDARATNDKVARNVFRKGDAWYRTGDLVARDSEGRFFFRDRSGDTFRWKGENVSTAEAAACIGEVDGVLEANVYGVRLPHHDGRAGCAAVVLRRTANGDRDTTQPGEAEVGRILQAIASHVTRHLPRYARPVFLRVVRGPDGLAPNRTGTNKQQKNVLREQGADPSRIGPDDRLFWLRDGKYVPFRDAEWRWLCAGQARL